MRTIFFFLIIFFSLSNYSQERKSFDAVRFISPPKIDIKTFPLILSKVLDTGIASVFQLRLKNYKDKDLIKITHLLSKICIKKNVFFITRRYELSTNIYG